MVGDGDGWIDEVEGCVLMFDEFAGGDEGLLVCAWLSFLVGASCARRSLPISYVKLGTGVAMNISGRVPRSSCFVCQTNLIFESLCLVHFAAITK